MNKSARKENIQSTSAEKFARQVKKYDLWYSRHSQIYESEVLAIKALDLEGFGLDIGVGTGALSYQISVTVGIDPSFPMLRVAHKRGIQTIRAVGEYLPFKDNVFDYVLMTVTFCFLDDPKKVLAETRRSIRSNGHLAVCIVNRNSAWGRLYIEKASKGHRFYRFAKFYSFIELSKILKESGFRAISVKSTLSYAPEDLHVVEQPTEDISRKGLICVKCEIDQREEAERLL